MVLRHLRANAVAYLALVVALTTGTSYAAGQLGNNTVGTKQLKNNAVVGKKVKNGSLRLADLGPLALTGAQVQDGSIGAADLAPGVLLPARWASASTSEASDPVAMPNSTFATFSFSQPRAGTVYLRLFAPFVGMDCSVGLARIGLYLDGVPVPGSGESVPGVSGARSAELVAVPRTSAGNHTISMRGGCPAGTIGGVASSGSGQTFTVLSVSD